MGVQETDRDKSKASRILVASLVLYTLSFLLTVLVEPQHRPVRGHEVFFGGLLGILMYAFFALAALVVNREPRLLLVVVLFALPWLANVVYWRAVSRRLDGRGRGVLVHGVLAVVLGLTALWVPILTAFSPTRLSHPAFMYREGYWVWLASMAMLGFEGRVPRRDRLSKSKAEALAQYWDD